jgi:hypothetical protein
VNAGWAGVGVAPGSTAVVVVVVVGAGCAFANSMGAPTAGGPEFVAYTASSSHSPITTQETGVPAMVIVAATVNGE